MLYNLLSPLAQDSIFFNVFRYITFRSFGAILTALMICFIIGPRVIRWLKSKQKEGQPIRSDGPEGHLLAKKGTPTMGGILILISLIISTLLWADLNNGFVWVIIFVALTFGAIGFVDDYLKLTKRNSKGLRSRYKFLGQLVAAALATLFIWLLSPDHIQGQFALPFFKDFALDLGLFMIPVGIIVVVGASNAVNLTDGLDGLAIVPTMITAGCFALIAYLVGRIDFAAYLQIPYIPGSGELAVIGGALVGASLGFLWFNAPPAMVFMGDTGSLSMGGILGTISVITKHEIVLAIVGGIFVIETLSVMIQVVSYKLTGKRVFRMAPLHHHFEKKGWAEPTIVIRFWIIAAILALIGLSTLKLR